MQENEVFLPGIQTIQRLVLLHHHLCPIAHVTNTIAITERILGL